MSLNIRLSTNISQVTMLEQLGESDRQPKQRRIMDEESASSIAELADTAELDLADATNLFAESETEPTELSSEAVASPWFKSIPKSQLIEEILSIVTQASKERLSQGFQYSEIKQWRVFVMGVKPGATEEDKQNAVQGLLSIVHQASQRYSEKAEMVANETTSCSSKKIQWETIKKGIGSDSSEEKRITAAETLYKIIVDRENACIRARENACIRKRKRAETAPVLSRDQVLLQNRTAMLSIIEKASELVAEGHIQGDQGSSDQGVKKPGFQKRRWEALFQGLAQEASQEDQIIAAENLLDLTRNFSKFYNGKLASKHKESRQDTTYRHQWESIDQAMTPGASKEAKLKGVNKLASVILRQLGQEKNDAKKKVVKKDRPCNTTLNAALLLVVNKTSKYLVQNYQWNEIKSYDRSIQNSRWRILLKGITSEASEKGHEEAAKNLAMLAQDYQPRYAQGNGVKETQAKHSQRQLWNAVSKGIMPAASLAARQEAALRLNTILKHRDKDKSAKNQANSDLQAENQDSIEKEAGSPVQSTSQPSPKIPDDLLLSPMIIPQKVVSVPNELQRTDEFDIGISLNDSASEKQAENSAQSTLQPSSKIPAASLTNELQVTDEFDIDIFFNDSAFEKQAESPVQSTLQPSPKIPAVSVTNELQGADEFDIDIFFNDSAFE